MPEPLHFEPVRPRSLRPPPRVALLLRARNALLPARSRLDVDTLITLGLFSGVGLLASLLLLLLDYQLNGQLPSL